MNITAKLWSYCHVLRQDGVDNVEYIEQLTYLLFLKMADENGVHVPEQCSWKLLLEKEGNELTRYYEYVLRELNKQQGILGQIFEEPISKIKNPDSLKKIIEGIESIGWTKLDKDIQGEAFEGLLEKTANEGKKGAGQFFTPRPLIKAIIEVIKPDPSENEHYKIADVACGTAGFLTMAVEWAKNKVDESEWIKIRDNAYYGQELVVRPHRLALMNLFLHGVLGNITLRDSIYTENTFKGQFDCIVTNPPFGTRGVSGPPRKRQFKVETSNIQINFIQHVYESLTKNGRAAIVLPDSSLTDTKAKELWRHLLLNEDCNIHTIMKLPKGTFSPYANGIKACVVFIEKGTKTKYLWVYDARTDIPEITKSTRPINYEQHFVDFVKSYGTDPNGKSKRKESARFEKYDIKNIIERNFDLSFSKIKQAQNYKEPIEYVETLISTFERQLLNLKKLQSILDSR